MWLEWKEQFEQDLLTLGNAAGYTFTIEVHQ